MVLKNDLAILGLLSSWLLLRLQFYFLSCLWAAGFSFFSFFSLESFLHFVPVDVKGSKPHDIHFENTYSGQKLSNSAFVWKLSGQLHHCVWLAFSPRVLSRIPSHAVARVLCDSDRCQVVAQISAWKFFCLQQSFEAHLKDLDLWWNAGYETLICGLKVMTVRLEGRVIYWWSCHLYFSRFISEVSSHLPAVYKSSFLSRTAFPICLSTEMLIYSCSLIYQPQQLCMNVLPSPTQISHLSLFVNDLNYWWSKPFQSYFALSFLLILCLILILWPPISVEDADSSPTEAPFCTNLTFCFQGGETERCQFRFHFVSAFWIVTFDKKYSFHSDVNFAFTVGSGRTMRYE